MEATKDIFFAIGSIIKTFILQFISPSILVAKIFGSFSTCKFTSIHTIDKNTILE